MKNDSDVWVVIPNWNGEELIAKCLESLVNQSHKLTIIVVDNGSVDNSIKIIRDKFPKVILLMQKRNLGFAGGVNVGIRYAMSRGAKAIALFNNDAIADKDWLCNLLKTLNNDSSIGAVGSKQLFSNKKSIDTLGNEYSTWGVPFPQGRNHLDTGQYDEKKNIFSAPGGSPIYSTEMLEDVGLFDERFFAYYEDVDIGFRARLAGWEICYEPTAVVYHEVSATSSKLGSFTRFHSTKNFHLLFLKNMPGWLFWKYLPLFTLQNLRLGLGALAHRQLLAYLRGCFSAVKLFPHALRERRRIQSSRKVSVSEVDSWLYHGRPPKIPEL